MINIKISHFVRKDEVLENFADCYKILAKLWPPDTNLVYIVISKCINHDQVI